MDDFEGWNVQEFWEDLKMDSKPANDHEGIAIVGKSNWQDWITPLMKPFTSAEIKFFKSKEKEHTKIWIRA